MTFWINLVIILYPSLNRLNGWLNEYFFMSDKSYDYGSNDFLYKKLFALLNVQFTVVKVKNVIQTQQV